MQITESKSPKILLVEDETILAEGIIFNLKKQGYSVDWVKDGRAALENAFNNPYDLILLDIMLPYIDGFEVARRVREKFPAMPILMLTARTAVKDRVKGLEIGADDYLTKPFHLEELLARIKAMLRRSEWYRHAQPTIDKYRFGDNEINFRDFSCQSGRKSFHLTQKEAMLMKYLISRKNQIVSRRELLENVWNISAEIETRTVDIFIARLRKYFEPDPKKPVYLKSIRSAGYMFTENG
ncbi:MAG: response regulator transcription factor [Candidatus Marinimicrobia bacterium]|nr:response regulator transcription factor [Candidatus Neomarinimicrobiota bacterium]RKY61279.1 MAG: DNA-binding response regulator [Candidatus Neomarinimicrobiota bacterium]